MNIEEIEDVYVVSKRNGHYNLYSKTESGVYSPIKYLCSISKSGKNFGVLGNGKVSTIDRLVKQVEEKLESYEYNSEFYNPDYIDGYFEEIVITEFLESLGFSKENTYKGYQSFVYSNSNIYGFVSQNLSFSIIGLDPHFKEETVTINLSKGHFSWVSVACKRNVDDLKKSISDLLKPLMLSEATKQIMYSDKMSTNEKIDIKLKELRGVAVTEVSLKEKLKTELQDLINSL